MYLNRFLQECQVQLVLYTCVKRYVHSDPGGGGYSIYPWVGRCGPALHTLTLFKTKFTDFPTLFKTEFRFLIPCLRHLTRNHTLCSLVRRTLAQAVYGPRKDTLFKTKIDKIDTLFKTKIPKNIPWLAACSH